MILVCGSLADPVVELVCARLVDCGYAYQFLNLGVYPAGFEVCWNWAGRSVSGYIAGADWRLGLDELRSVYVRYPGPSWRAPVRDVAPAFAVPVHAECDAGLTLVLEHLPCTVVNRLGGGMSNQSKPYQGLLIRESGFLIPPTLVTNDPGAARQFIDECNGDVIYKSLSGTRSIVRRVGPRQRDRLTLLRHGPAQFQRFIAGDNIRVHTVGDHVFATRVRSETVDYRYAVLDGHAVEMEPTALPPSIAAACQQLARRLHLVLAGIDLKETPAGEYYCFEVNPSPAFLFYEQGGGQQISRALADLLRRASS